MQVYKYTFTKTALKLTKSYINFMRRPCFAMVILISKKLIEHYISLGNFEDNGQLFWIEDGGSDEVDVLINLDESKLETFVVHQHG